MRQEALESLRKCLEGQPRTAAVSASVLTELLAERDALLAACERAERLLSQESFDEDDIEAVAGTLRLSVWKAKGGGQ